MKITRRQLRRVIKEAMDRFGRDIYTDQLGNYNPRSGELPPNPFVAADKYRARRDGPEMRKKGFSDGFNGEFPQEEDDDAYMQGYEEGQAASDSGEYTLSEANLPADGFPPATHPVIAPYFNELKYRNTKGTSWAQMYVTYSYKHGVGTSGKQDLVIYLKKDGTYMARIFGAYNNRISDDDKGRHPDPISAVEAALNSSPTRRPPFAKDLLAKVGTKPKGLTGSSPMYD